MKLLSYLLFRFLLFTFFIGVSKLHDPMDLEGQRATCFVHPMSDAAVHQHYFCHCEGYASSYWGSSSPLWGSLTYMKDFDILFAICLIFISDYRIFGNEFFSQNTPGEYSFVVPNGASSINVVATAASGGSDRTATGGFGAVVTATLSVTPETTYYIYVGGVGTSRQDTSYYIRAGGFNGGGGSGYYYGAGGGGATDIRSSTSLDSRILVAGGGGGGDGSCGSGYGGNGGYNGDTCYNPCGYVSPGGDAVIWRNCRILL